MHSRAERDCLEYSLDESLAARGTTAHLVKFCQAAPGVLDGTIGNTHWRRMS